MSVCTTCPAAHTPVSCDDISLVSLPTAVRHCQHGSTLFCIVRHLTEFIYRTYCYCEDGVGIPIEITVVFEMASITRSNYKYTSIALPSRLYSMSQSSLNIEIV